MSRAGLDPRAMQGLGKRLALRLGHLALRVQVALLAHQHARHRGRACVVQNLVVHRLDHLKGRSRGNRVHEHIAVDANRMLRVQDRVLILPSRIDNVAVVVLAAVLDRLFKHILNRRVVGINKRVFHKPHDKRRLADGPRAKHGNLALLAHLLGTRR